MENFNVFNADDLSIPPKSIAVHDPEGTLSNFLTSKGVDFVLFDANVDPKTPLLVGLSKNKEQYDLDAEIIRNFVKKGGCAVFFEVKGKNSKNSDRVLKEISHHGLPTQAEILGKCDGSLPKSNNLFV